MKQALKVHKGKIDLVVGGGSGKSISTNDSDPLSTTKTQSIAQPSSAERNNRNSKENSSSRTCRCAAGTSNKTTGRLSAAKSTTSTATNTNTVELLQNPKALPIREFEKLSPAVSATIANSGRSSLSSVSSSIVDPIHGEKTIARNTTATTASTTTASNSETIAARNTNNQIDKLKKKETAASANSVETIYLNILNKKNLEKLLQSNASLTESKSSSSEKESCSSLGGGGAKRLANGDTLILRICDLEYGTRYSSTSPVSTATQNGRTSSDCIKVKTKVRTKTDPHPVSSSQKQRRFSSTTTSTIDLKNYKKCSSQSAVGQHNGSKCNCSSCNVSKASSLSSENKTKSVGTQHNAAAQCAFDPWVKQSTVATDNKRGTRSGDSNSNARTEKSLLKQKIAHSNAKVIVITDDFKKKALNQEVLVDTKRKILRYMKANKLLSSSRSMDDVRIAASASTVDDSNQANATLNMNEHQMNTSVLSINKSSVGVNNDDPANGSTNTADVKKLKAISKSVDNISVLSAELDALDNVGSVELIFISDEFLNKVSDQDVIVLKNNPKIPAALVARKLATGKSLNGNDDADSNAKHFGRKQIIVITDEFCRKSMKNKKIVIVEAQNKNEVANSKVTKHQQLNRQSSAESSVDDVNNKITSRAFQSYDEEAEHLESKKIQ